MHDWALWATIGAIGALVIREWVEKIMRTNDRQRKCYHRYRKEDEVTWSGFTTKICHKCGHQEQKRSEDDSEH